MTEVEPVGGKESYLKMSKRGWYAGQQVRCVLYCWTLLTELFKPSLLTVSESSISNAKSETSSSMFSPIRYHSPRDNRWRLCVRMRWGVRGRGRRFIKSQWSSNSPTEYEVCIDQSVWNTTLNWVSCDEAIESQHHDTTLFSSKCYFSEEPLCYDI